MSEIISGNMVGGAAPLRTLKIVDGNGTEIVGVVVSSEVVFTADASSDIREGKVAATDAGVVVGTAFIPNYNTCEGFRVVPKGGSFVLPLQDDYDYTKLQAIICEFNTSVAKSVAAKHVAIDNNLYEVQSTTMVSSITKDFVDKSIDFGVSNTSDGIRIIRYFMYREMY